MTNAWDVTSRKYPWSSESRVYADVLRTADPKCFPHRGGEEDWLPLTVFISKNEVERLPRDDLIKAVEQRVGFARKEALKKLEEATGESFR